MSNTAQQVYSKVLDECKNELSAWYKAEYNSQPFYAYRIIDGEQYLSREFSERLDIERNKQYIRILERKLREMELRVESTLTL